MSKQIGNLEVPEIRNTYDCYGNICTSSDQAWYNRNLPDYGETYDNSLEYLWQIEYRKESDIPEIIATFDRDELIEHCDSKIKRCIDRYNEFGGEWIEKHCGIYNKILEVLR